MSTPQPVPYDPLGALAAQQSAPTPAYDPLGDVAAGKDAPTTQAPSWMQENVERPLGLAGRAVATGVAALPLMAMDAGVASRNLIGDWANKELGQPASQDYELPSKEFQDALTQAGFPTPSTPVRKERASSRARFREANSPQKLAAMYRRTSRVQSSNCSLDVYRE